MHKKHDSARRGRVLAFENLENRELLSVNPLSTPVSSTDNDLFQRAWLVESGHAERPGPIDFTLSEEKATLEISNGIADPGIPNGSSIHPGGSDGGDDLNNDNSSEIENTSGDGLGGSLEESQLSSQVDLSGFTLMFGGTQYQWGASNGTSDSLFGVESVSFTNDTQCTITCAGKEYDGAYSYNNYSLTFSCSGGTPVSLPVDVHTTIDSFYFNISIDSADVAKPYPQTSEGVLSFRANGKHDNSFETTLRWRHTEMRALDQPTITSVASAASKIDLEWAAVDGAVGYEVTYRTTKSTKTNTVFIRSDTTKASLFDLSPKTSYYVKVVALGDHFSTQDSQNVPYSTVKTKAFVTLSQPKITSVDVDLRSIDLEWNDVGADVRYRVTCSPTSSNDVVSFTLSPGMTKFSFNSLTPGTSYTVKVVALGDGLSTKDSAAATKTVKTKALETLTQPKIRTVESDKRSITITWDDVSSVAKGENNRKQLLDVLAYRVIYSAINSKESGSFEVPYYQTKAMIDGLTPGTSYNVKVVALGNGQTTVDSKATSVTKVKTEPLTVLAQPEIIGLEARATTASLLFNAVDGAAGYQVKYRVKNSSKYETLFLRADQIGATIPNLTPETSYEFKVVALGDGIDTLDSKAATKTVKTEALHALTQPTITELTSDKRSILVKWRSSDHVLGRSFQVTCRDTKTNEIKTFEVPQREISAVYAQEIADLTPGTNYEIKIVAIGDGYFSKDSKATVKKVATKSLDRLAQPKITDSYADLRSIDIAWNAVDNAMGYEVRYRSSNGKEFGSFYVEAVGAPWTTIGGLTPGTSYTVKVVALGDGWDTVNSKDSAYKKITTKAMTKLAKPTITSCQTTQTSLRVNWKPIADADQIAVYYKKAGTKEEEVVFCKGGETYCTLYGLEEGAKYSVRVVALGDGDKTLDSASSATKTIALAKVPKRIAPILTHYSATPCEVTVEWTDVEGHSGPCGSYEVSYRPAGAKKATTAVVVNKKFFTITGLKPNQSVDVKVRALGDSIADSDFSQEQTYTTASQTILATPTGLSAVPSETGIYLCWTPVRQAMGYEIEVYETGGTTSSTYYPDSNTIAYKTSGNKPGTRYKIRIRALGDGDYYITSEFSSFIEVETSDSLLLDDSPSLPSLGD